MQRDDQLGSLRELLDERGPKLEDVIGERNAGLGEELGRYEAPRTSEFYSAEELELELRALRKKLSVKVAGKRGVISNGIHTVPGL